MHNRLPGIRAILFLLLLLFNSFADAKSVDQEIPAGKTPHRVPRVEETVKVDGVLDEPVWKQALVMELQYEVRPGDNIPPPVRTEVLFAYNDRELLVAFRAFDPDPSKIRARLNDRDRLWSDDWVAINLDTFNDERHSFLFVCNPLGIQADLVETNGEGTSWDAIWSSSGRISAEGYVVEMAIPFGSLRFQRGNDDQVWGVDAIRSYPRSVRHHIGLFPRDRNNNCYLCQAEKLIGFAGVSPGRNIELDPTLSGIFAQEREDVPPGRFMETKSSLEPGITGKWGLTPNLIFSATVNPDFSQVEADAAQLDVNRRFALYYPERRPFFLEGAEIFKSDLDLVHTRTLSDPVWGAKLTGTERGNTIGYFSVGDRLTNLIIPSSESSESVSLDKPSTGSVLRYRRDLFKSSNVGIIITDREGEGYYNRLAGLDGRIDFTGKDSFRFGAVRSITRYPEEVFEETDINGNPDEEIYGSAAGFMYRHETSNWNCFTAYRGVTSDFRADLGFVTQAGYNEGEIGAGYIWYNDSDHWWNQLRWGGSYTLAQQQNRELLEKNFGAWFNFNGPLQSYASLYVEAGTESYQQRWYQKNILWFSSGLQPSSDAKISLNIGLGDDIDYDNDRPASMSYFGMGLDYKLGKHISLSFDPSLEMLHVRDGRLYTAMVNRLKLRHHFSRRAFLRLIVQEVDVWYNTALYSDDQEARSSNIAGQILYSYKINARTVFYLGYSDNISGDESASLVETDRTVFCKIGYALVL